MTRYADLMEPVARLLRGEPNERLSSRDELRFGSHGSLAVDVRAGRWYDHETSEGGGVLDFVAREQGIAERRAQFQWLVQQGLASNAAQVCEATYDYQDEQGNLLFQVVRLYPKTFRQRRPDGRGGWVASVKGVRPVPYRLPQLQASPEARVYVVEGEKDADRLARGGLVATCNPGGAKKWRRAHAECLAGRDVVVLPDNDEAGAEHGRLVAASLAGIARTVRILNLPGLPEKGDVCDWLDAGHDLDELERLASQAESPPAIGLAETIGGLLSAVTIEELLQAREPHPHAFMRGEMGAFPIGEVSVVGAPGREGKTTILVSTLARFVLGLPMAGLAPIGPRRAVILSAEDSRIQYVRKLGAVLETLDAQQHATLCDRLRIPDLDNPAVRAHRQLVSLADRQPVATAMVDALIEALTPLAADPVPVGLIVVETASTFNDAGEDNPGLRMLADACKRIARALNAAVVLVHHTSQSSRNNLSTLEISSADVRGGTALIDNTRQTWLLVNLGSPEDPYGETDGRTTLRDAVAPGNPHRVTMLVCLDSSKSEAPPPAFLQWERSVHYGPRAMEITPPADVRRSIVAQAARNASSGTRWPPPSGARCPRARRHRPLRGRRASAYPAREARYRACRVGAPGQGRRLGATATRRRSGGG